MPLQNRVTPTSELVAEPGRGLVYGNRGCLHDADGTIRRRFNGKRWIACRLEFRGWHREPLLQPGRFTELFFLDEATAFAAGPPALRALPARGLHPVLRALARAPSGPGRARMRSTRSSTRSGWPRTAPSDGTTRRSTSFPTERSSWTRARRGSSSAASCCAGRRRVMRSGALGVAGSRRGCSRHRRSSPCSAPARRPPCRSSSVHSVVSRRARPWL